MFYEHVCLALRAIDDGVAAVSARSSASFGTVNLGTTFTTQDHYLPSLIRDFEEAFDKRVIVKVSQGFTNYLTEQLHRGTLDVAFCGKRDNEPDIAYFPVKHCELALYVRDDHPLASADTITFGELNDVDLHTYRRGNFIGRARGEDAGGGRRAALPGQTTTTINHVGRSLLQRRQRRALMLDSLGAQLFSNLHPGARRGRPRHFYTVYMAYHKKHVHSRAITDFVKASSYPGNDLIGQVLPEAAGRVGAPGPIGRDGRSADVWVSGRPTAGAARPPRPPDCRLWSFCAVCGHLLREAGKSATRQV